MREVLSNTTETHLHQHWRSGEMKFQQIYFFKWAVFSKVIFISLFSYSIENKTRHIHIFPKNCKDDLYRDNVEKPEAQLIHVKNSQKE